MHYVQKITKCQMFINFLFCSGLLFLFYIKCTSLRAWYNGSTSASQAEDEGSIPFARTKNTADPCGRIYFWRCGVGREPDRVANGNERVRDEAQHSERGPWSENEHGNIHSLRPHHPLSLTLQRDWVCNEIHIPFACTIRRPDAAARLGLYLYFVLCKRLYRRCTSKF